MKRILFMLLAVGGLTALALSTANQPTNSTDNSNAKFVVDTDKKNPWTSLTPNVAADQFQFAIVSDRTGGHRKGVFSKAVHQVNLLQPAFVMSVGDLIEGARQEEMNRTQWDEFDKYARQFAMPFFYCAGNHDGDNKVKAEVWKERLGKAYYHFLYGDCLFLVLNSNDLGINAPVPAAAGVRGPRIGFGKEQLQYVEKTLKDNAKVRWTFVFMHHPVWAARDLTENGWLEFEKLFANRQYSTFCGHEHTFRKFIRNERSYYQLATTGGVSSMRGIEYGEFDQIAWVTMKKDGPVIAQVALEGILKDDLTKIEPSEENGSKPLSTEGLNEVVGSVTMNGKPVTGLQAQFIPLDEPAPRANAPEYSLPGGMGLLQLDGSFTVYQHRGPAGLKAGRYAVTFAPTTSLIIDSTKKDNPVPEKYRAANTTPYRVEVKVDVRNRFEFKLDKE
ncbi:metallophosphoesterase [Telmatocola sphagniphila]|uniref:Metallophosphoesterase n=1 Tax=Telmatocola sphagniphila TaxID=1123043 RepID=A0A8E6EUE9_9BACT|nr:metallophosphoesterase [Telmatocola sphagniphila]QVL31300.1 metallophosphoesterase [Telmatocola sphagniphila]